MPVLFKFVRLAAYDAMLVSAFGWLRPSIFLILDCLEPIRL